ncbi:TadE/TadG family type IV pilus assembly protein [Phycicoccus sonneratiae]|uniref:Pilus assembly protein n=1 Tax=Phycicoccus sonneratiae TaxID=2807628 RepID=A0ABS2CR83_9MICO|nr:TadE family protein [Phycicoccus sonneraticus]MBM6402295.1 pilus assembly protein [Phycicoccus sonneraticus]
MRPATGPRRRHQRVPARAERGSTSIQMVLLMPALFAVMFLGMQAALYYHARAIALASAQEGARAAGAQDGTTSAGIAAARDYLSATAGDALSATRVTGYRSTTTATITVRGTPLAVIPAWAPPVVQSATVTVERITQ